MLPDSKLYFLRHALIAQLKRLVLGRPRHDPYGDFEVSRLLPWGVDVTFVAYPESGLHWLKQLILTAAENHASATTNAVSSYSELRRQFPFLPALLFTHAGSSWRWRMLNEADLTNYSPGEWISSGKVVFLHRNPANVLAAAFQDLHHNLDLHQISPADVIENTIVGARKTARFTNRWHAWCANNPNCLEIAYEELAADPRGPLKKISDFCDFGFSEPTIAIACQAGTPHTFSAVENNNVTAGPWGYAGGGPAKRRLDATPSNNGQTFTELFSQDEIKRIEKILSDERAPAPRSG